MRLPGWFFLALVAIGLQCCGSSSSPQQGGSGTEAGNGIMVEAISKDGGRVAGARVEIRPAGSDSQPAMFTASTGSDGKVNMSVPSSGRWSVLVRHQGKAFWRIVEGASTLADTLRAVSRLSGWLEDCRNTRISVPGMGLRTACNDGGYFQLDSMPSGLVPVRFSDSIPDPSPREALGRLAAPRAARVAAWKVREIQVQIQPGRDASLILRSDWAESGARPVPTDTLAVWAKESMPVSLSRGPWGDTGVFSLAIRARRIDTVDRLTVLSWAAGDSNGLTIRWQGLDTLVVEVGGQKFIASDTWLDLDRDQSIGVIWDGERLQVKVASWSRVWEDAPGLKDRTGWSDPKLGTPGACQIQWVASVRGPTEDTWLNTVEKGGRGETSSSVSGEEATTGASGGTSILPR